MWCLFEIWTLCEIIFVKDSFKRKNRLSERHFLTKIFIFLKIVFSKDNFWPKFGQKVYFKKMVFMFKSVFHKDDFEWVHILNKHHKSHIWPKNFKKKNVFFSNFGPNLTPLYYFKPFNVTNYISSINLPSLYYFPLTNRLVLPINGD